MLMQVIFKLYTISRKVCELFTRILVFSCIGEAALGLHHCRVGPSVNKYTVLLYL